MMTRFHKCCLIYCRVSDPRQATEGASLATQENLLRELAAKMGIEVVRVFVESGESAKTANRTELKKMMSFARTHQREIDSILVYKFNRFARDMGDHHELRRYFNKLGIQVLSLCERVDDTPAGRLQENILAAVNQFDNEDRAENCRNGMIGAIKDGRFVWPAPVGYVNGKVNGKPNIVPEVSQAAHVLRVFERLRVGVLPEDTRRAAAEDGLRNRKGRFLSTAQFHRMIRNPVYMGRIDAFGLRVNGTFEPIVPGVLFSRVQEILDGRRRNVSSRYRSADPDFPLRGLLLCTQCGHRYTASWNRGRTGLYPNYRCQTCRGAGTNIPRATLHERFRSLLKQYEVPIRETEALKTAVLGRMHERFETGPRRLRAIDQEMEQLRNDKKELLKRDLRGMYDDSSIVPELLNDFDQQLARLTDEQERIRHVSDSSDTLTRAIGLLTDLAFWWDSADLELQVRFQRFLFPNGLVYDKNGEFGTIPTPLIITLKRTLLDDSSHLVDPDRGIWNQLIEEAEQLNSIFRHRDTNDPVPKL